MTLWLHCYQRSQVNHFQQCYTQRTPKTTDLVLTIGDTDVSQSYKSRCMELCRLQKQQWLQLLVRWQSCRPFIMAPEVRPHFNKSLKTPIAKIIQMHYLEAAVLRVCISIPRNI